MDPLLGTLVAGRYRLERKLGQGGMGSVYEATDTALRRAVAVKLLHEGAHPELLSRFSLEARAIASLAHPHIAALFDFHASNDPRPALIMERLDGESLRALLAREKRLAPARAVHVARQILSALEVAHAIGTIHRDIKPSNVMLVRSSAVSDLVKLVDFGVAKMVDETTRQHATARGSAIGTMQYMSPDQAAGLPPQPATDLYAVGVCLFEMIAGYNPFAVGDISAVLMAVRNVIPPPLDQLVPGVPRHLADAVARALVKDPSQRFARASDFSQALGVVAEPGPPSGITALQGPPSQAWSPATLPGPAQAPASRGLLWAVVVLLALLVLVAGVGVAIFAHGGTEPQAATASASASPSVAPSAVPAAVSVADAGPRPSRPGTKPLSSGAPTSPNAGADAGAARRGCMCLPIRQQAGFVNGTSLCQTLAAPICRCELTDNPYVSLCLAPWTLGPGEPACSTPNSAQPGHQRGAACSGYDTINTKRAGAYACNYCRDTRTYAGTQGGACRGYQMSTTAGLEGVLDCE